MLQVALGFSIRTLFSRGLNGYVQHNCPDARQQRHPDTTASSTRRDDGYQRLHILTEPGSATQAAGSVNSSIRRTGAWFQSTRSDGTRNHHGLRTEY
jgi:hypothetical protein